MHGRVTDGWTLPSRRLRACRGVPSPTQPPPYGVEQVARDYFVNTGTINSWIRKGRVTPTVSFPFGSRMIIRAVSDHRYQTCDHPISYM